ncbi:putative PEP-binding protein, partial [Vogesella mureinivorans]|uniref:putative PEP-binding protein n=1 Tax=Vogesella mureinivorans TaxID=657276 RepID=UPI0030B8A8A1
LSTSVCGEMAGDPTHTRLLLALGLTEFSLHPNTLLEVRAIIRDSHLAELRKLGSRLLRASDRAGIERLLKATVGARRGRKRTGSVIEYEAYE